MSYTAISRFMIASSLALGVAMPADANTGSEKDADRKGGSAGHSQRDEYSIAGYVIPQYLLKLNLTDDQKSQIGSLVYNEAQLIQEKIKAIRHHKTESHVGEIAQLAEQQLRTDEQIYRLLTPEQREQLEERRAQFESGYVGTLGKNKIG